MSKIKNFIAYAIFIAILLSFFLWAGQQLFAQSLEEQVCASPRDETERQLCVEYQKLKEEEAALQQTLSTQKNQSATISGELKLLTDQIKKSQIAIEQRNLAIKRIGGDIELKDQTVQELNSKLVRSQDALGQLIKRTNELDDISLTEIILANENLSDFFVNIDTYNQLQSSLEDLMYEIRETRGFTEEEKIALEKKRAAERDVKAEIEAQKRQVEVKEDEKDKLLQFSKQTEATLSQYITEKQQRAAQIRAALFSLRDVEGISFGDAVRYATVAGNATGVRPALILAILKQESDLGKNVGTCNRSGDPETKKYTAIMPGPIHYANYLANGKSCTGAASPCSWRDDQTVFKEIAAKVGRDYNTTPLSCPIASVGGWGGAMGPSQFIPATWKSYESRIASALGVSTPDPWNPEHAFTATALYLADLGAAAGGYTAEHTAAAKYYAGGNYAGGPGQSYGTSVLSHATGFQDQITFLKETD
jgi:membrane-bound lytic murein transglycosylase B